MVTCRIAIWDGVAIALVLMLGLLHQRARAADTGATLSAIADTADRICGIVATRGEASVGEAGGDVHAELSGLAKRLASLGVSAKGDITSSTYQGVLQQDLPNTMKDNSECKLKVLDKLQAAILPAGAAQPVGPDGPTVELLQSPSSAPLLDVTKSPTLQEDYGLYSCGNSPTAITCYVVVTRLAPGQADYELGTPSAQRQKLVDNFHVEHRLLRAYFINGLGGQQQKINLSTGESTWFELAFEPGSRAVSSARIIFNTYGNYQLRGPVT